jgi:hypothetical protein
VIEDVRESGITVVGSDLWLEGSLVRDAKGTESAGTFGDGVSVVRSDQDANAFIWASRIEATARAGVSNFGGKVEISTTTLECNPIQLNGESLEGADASFVDSGGVGCGCAGSTETCAVSSSELTPPEPLTGQ